MSKDTRVYLGLAFRRWRELKSRRGMKSDADLAFCLLNEMDKVSTLPGSMGANNQSIKISKSEVQTLIEQEVHKGLAKNQVKMRGLIEAVQQMNNDLNFEKTLRDLETQLNTVSRKAEAALAYITKTHEQSLPSFPGNDDSGSGASGEDSMDTLQMSNKKELKTECVLKIGELIQRMETTTTELKSIQADNDELTAAMVNLNEEELPPILTRVDSSYTETNEQNHLSSVNKKVSVESNLREMSPPLLSSVGSSEDTVHVKSIKRELEDNQDEENDDGNPCLPEEPKVKKMKDEDSSGHSVTSSDEGQELLLYPALPSFPFPSVLNMEAASYSMPQKVELKLALIRHPTRLSVLWNVTENDPAAPPMDSYTIFLTMEKVKGSGTFPKWTSYDQLKAAPLPMGALIKKYKPGHRVCAAVIGKDKFGRYGPYSEVVTKTMPDQL